MSLSGLGSALLGVRWGRVSESIVIFKLNSVYLTILAVLVLYLSIFFAKDLYQYPALNDKEWMLLDHHDVLAEYDSLFGGRPGSHVFVGLLGVPLP